MNSQPFNLFIGIDWSGAKGPSLPGLRVAACNPGAGAPTLVQNPHQTHWTRRGLADWLLALVKDGQRVLMGMDFSFCFPWDDHQAYLPGMDSPTTKDAFWQAVEDASADQPDFFGGGFAETHHQYFAVSGSVGAQYERRLRVTEAACQQQGLGTPETVFNLRGARQVGKSSLSGMRVLRHLQRETDMIAVWPFDEPLPGQSVIVETFPTAFARMASVGTGKIRDQDRLQQVLAQFDADPDGAPWPITDDDADALVTAAALRQLSAESHWWYPDGLSDRVRRYEGWTFGVR